MITWTVAWVVFALWAWKIGYEKGHAFSGLVLGVTLAYVGVLVIACFPRNKAKARPLPSAGQLAGRLTRQGRQVHQAGAHAKGRRRLA